MLVMIASLMQQCRHTIACVQAQRTHCWITVLSSTRWHACTWKKPSVGRQGLTVQGPEQSGCLVSCRITS